MSGIALTTPVTHASDATCDVQIVGINYDNQRVLVRLEFQPGGQTKDYTFGVGGIESITALATAVPNFSGLRTALLQHLQTLDSTLGGVVS